MEFKQHHLGHLFKYTTLDTAKKIIQTQSLRWSSPLLFNDPFDHQVSLSFPFSGEALNLAIQRLVASVLDGKPYEPTVDGSLSRMLLHMQSRRLSLPRGTMIDLMRAAGEQMARDFRGQCENLNEQIAEFLLRSRVLCLAEFRDNVVMWSHYAHEHKGVVFEFGDFERLDHRFLLAQPVTYSNALPQYMSLTDYVNNLAGLGYHDAAPYAWKLAHHKHEDWRYEHEWRLHESLLDRPQGDGISYYQEPKELFQSVYLGCRMLPEEIEAVSALVRAHLPRTKICVASKRSDRIGLGFEELT